MKRVRLLIAGTRYDFPAAPDSCLVLILYQNHLIRLRTAGGQIECITMEYKDYYKRSAWSASKRGRDQESLPQAGVEVPP